MQAPVSLAAQSGLRATAKHAIGLDAPASDEAMRRSREAIRQRGDFVDAHRVLTAAAMAEQDDVATAALHELRRVQPNISLAWIAHQMPIKRDADREHYLEGFRRAGLD
jgi:ribose 1,5-bisphosphokinase PhnN